MKTIQELHIGIDIALQYVAANRVRSLKIEEKDWLLNQCLLELIHSKINPKSNLKKEGFEDTQKRIDDLAIIKTDPVILPCYYFDNETVFCNLPIDYLHLINDKTISYFNCDFKQNYIERVVTTCGSIVYLNKTLLPNQYNTFKIKLKKQDNSIVTLFDATNYNINIVDTSMLFVLIDYILTIVNYNSNTTNVTAYFEYFDNKYYYNSFIFTTSCLDKEIIISYQGKSGETEIKYPIIPLAIYKSRDYRNAKEVTYVNRLSNSEFIPNMMVSYYSKTRVDSPISYITGNRLYVKYDNTFYPKAVIIEYLRRPRKMNYYLGITNELYNLEDELIQRVAERVKASISDTGYQFLNVEHQKQE